MPSITVRTNLKEPSLDLTLEALVHCFNVASKILFFEGNPNAVSSLVYKYENRHLIESEQIWLRGLREGMVRPDVLQTKYEVDRDKNKTSRTVIYVYDDSSVESDSEKVFMINKPRVFADDIDTVAVFLPESFIDVDATEADLYRAYYEVFLALIAGNYGLYRSGNRDFISGLAKIFTKLLMPDSSVVDNIFKDDEHLTKYFKLISNFAGLDEYNGTIVLNAKPNTKEYTDLKDLINEFYLSFGEQ